MMAEGVIDEFEFVEINQKQRAAALIALQYPRQIPDQRMAVANAGQCILKGLDRQRSLSFVAPVQLNFQRRAAAPDGAKYGREDQRRQHDDIMQRVGLNGCEDARLTG